MDIQNVFLAIAWLVAAPATVAPSGPAWQPPAAVDPAAFDTAHLDVERLHERWLPSAIDWDAPREFAINMVCDLGLITLAIMDCSGLTAGHTPPAHPAGVLLLGPLKQSAPGGGSVQPDFRDLRRRSIEERMHSI